MGDAASSAYDSEDDDDYSEEEQSGIEDQCNVTHLYIPHPPNTPAVIEDQPSNVNASTVFPPPTVSNHRHHPGVTALAPNISITEVPNYTGVSHRIDMTSPNVAYTTPPIPPKKLIILNRTPSSAGSQTSGPEIR